MTTITSQVADVLIANGKAAVEAELSRIEADLTTAKNKAVNEAATLATQLANYLNAHATEVTSAQALITRANATTAGSVPPVSTVPAITLSKPRTVGNFIAGVKSYLATHGWKGYALLGIGVLVLHYMWTHKIII